MEKSISVKDQKNQSNLVKVTKMNPLFESYDLK